MRKRFRLAHSPATSESKSDESLLLPAHILDSFHSAGFHLPASVLDQVGHETVEDALERFVEFQFPQPLGMAPVHAVIGCREHRHFRAELIEIENARFESVVEIGGVVRDFVHQVDELRFERRALVRADIQQAREIPPRHSPANV